MILNSAPARPRDLESPRPHGQKFQGVVGSDSVVILHRDHRASGIGNQPRAIKKRPGLRGPTTTGRTRRIPGAEIARKSVYSTDDVWTYCRNCEEPVWKKNVTSSSTGVESRTVSTSEPSIWNFTWYWNFSLSPSMTA